MSKFYCHGNPQKTTAFLDDISSNLNAIRLILPFLGDKFGESLRGSQASPSFWKVPGLPRKFPQLPRKFFGDFPGSSLTVELSSNPGVPRKFPRLPRKFPELPRRVLGLPRRSAPFLGSLTPSLDLQNLPLGFSVSDKASLGKQFSGVSARIPVKQVRPEYSRLVYRALVQGALVPENVLDSSGHLQDAVSNLSSGDTTASETFT